MLKSSNSLTLQKSDKKGFLKSSRELSAAIFKVKTGL